MAALSEACERRPSACAARVGLQWPCPVVGALHRLPTPAGRGPLPATPQQLRPHTCPDGLDRHS